MIYIYSAYKSHYLRRSGTHPRKIYFRPSEIVFDAMFGIIIIIINMYFLNYIVHIRLHD